jgi:NADPH2:quinone reductase
MKAAYIEQVGPPQAIQYGELPMPTVGRKDVLVKMVAVEVNAVDTYIRSGSLKTALPFPFIIGRDMVGIVIEIGQDVTRFRPGERVWTDNQGYDGRQGTFAEYCRVDERLLYHLPAGIDMVEAASVLHSSLTAVLGLFFKARLAAGETVFINGGDGNVGTAVLQLAKASGARVLVTAGNEEKAQWCRALGADLVINYKTQDVTRAIKEVAPQGVHVYWDTTTHFDAARALDMMAQRGRIIVMAGPSQQTILPVGPFYLRNCTLYGFTVTDATMEELQRYADQMNVWFARGLPKGKIAQQLPLSHAAEAHQLYETRSLFGKLVLVPD